MTNFVATNFFPQTTVVDGITIVNLTPHPLNIIGLEGETRTYHASGYSVRVSTKKGTHVATVGSVHVPMFTRDEVGEVVLIDNKTKEVVCPLSDVPYDDKMLLIVSGLAGSHLHHRQDCFVPCTSPSDNPVRNDKGHIVAVRGIKKP